MESRDSSTLERCTDRPCCSHNRTGWSEYPDSLKVDICRERLIIIVSRGKGGIQLDFHKPAFQETLAHTGNTLESIVGVVAYGSR